MERVVIGSVKPLAVSEVVRPAVISELQGGVDINGGIIIAVMVWGLVIAVVAARCLKQEQSEQGL